MRIVSVRFTFLKPDDEKVRSIWMNCECATACSQAVLGPRQDVSRSRQNLVAQSKNRRRQSLGDFGYRRANRRAPEFS